jgi:transcriptional regulator with XRE-family HTH domain
MTPAELRDLMAAAKVNRATCAEKLGVSPVTVWRWLKGHTPISRQVASFVKQTIRPK